MKNNARIITAATDTATAAAIRIAFVKPSSIIH